MKNPSQNYRIFRAASALLLSVAAGSTPGVRAQEPASEPIAKEPTAQLPVPNPAPEEAPAEAAAEATPPEQLVMTLFRRETTPEEYDAALARANAAGVSAQVLLESQIVRSFYSQDKDKLVSLKIPLQNFGPNLDLKNSQLFVARSDYESMLEAIRALEAEQQDDAAGFEKHIKQALWLSPPLYQPLFLSWLNEYRQNEAMKKIIVPLDTKLPMAAGGETTLQNLMGDNKAMLLDFWASWCAPCMVLMDDLKAKGEALAPQGVVVVGLNTEASTEKATAVKEQEKITMPWLVEPESMPYSSLLSVEGIPRMVLITREGKVLFNGHPNDPALKRALAKIGANL
jgi:thiol-disulfide isomerase/thioredoxin